jgi:hypothetical protein
MLLSPGEDILRGLVARGIDGYLEKENIQTIGSREE